MALLTVTSHLEAGRQFPIVQDETILGRGNGLPIRLDGSNISRQHARIVRDSIGYFVEDMGSSNGTFVNEKRIFERTTLSPNDILRVGSYSFRFDLQESAGEMTIHRQTVASPGNDEIYRENSALKLQAVLQLAHDLGNTLEIDELLNRFLDQALRLFPQSDRAIVLFLSNGEPVVRLTRDRRAKPGNEPFYSRSVLKHVLDKGLGVLAEDTRGFDANMTLNAAGVRSLLCVPLRAHGTPVFGAVQFDRFNADHPFSNDDLHLLTAITLQISMALDKARLHERLIAQERIDRELALAREIQQAFLPQCVPRLPEGEIEVFAELHPAEEVSGDFYDMIPLDERRIALLVADVSGKGMPAALFMSMIRVLLRQLAKPGIPPAQVLRQLNETVARDNPKFMFVTIVFCIYDVASGDCCLARGGHPAPILLSPAGQAREVECHAGCLIGICHEPIRIEEHCVTLAPGEMMIFYSDGITEAANGARREMYGTKRLMEAAQRFSREKSLKRMAELLRSELDQFCAPDRPQDDVTLLFLRHCFGAVSLSQIG